MKKEVLPYDDPLDKVIDYMAMALSRITSTPARERTSRQKTALTHLERRNIAPLLQMAFELMDQDILEMYEEGGLL